MLRIGNIRCLWKLQRRSQCVSIFWMSMIFQTFVLSPAPVLFHWIAQATPWEQLLFLFLEESKESMYSLFPESAFWIMSQHSDSRKLTAQPGKYGCVTLTSRLEGTTIHILPSSHRIRVSHWRHLDWDFQITYSYMCYSGKVTSWKPVSDFALKFHISVFIMKMTSEVFLIIGIWYILP